MASGYTVVEVDASARERLLSGDAEAWRRCDAIPRGQAPWTTAFRAAWSREALYLCFDAADDRPWHTLTARDDRLWNEEVVEIFLDPTGPAKTKIFPLTLTTTSSSHGRSWAVSGKDRANDRTLSRAPATPDGRYSRQRRPQSVSTSAPSAKERAAPCRIGRAWLLGGRSGRFVHASLRA